MQACTKLVDGDRPRVDNTRTLTEFFEAAHAITPMCVPLTRRVTGLGEVQPQGWKSQAHMRAAKKSI